jgi:hypothetical protein
MPEPYTDAELQAGARAALLEVYAPDATDEEIAAVVLSAAAPLIAARVRAEVLEEAARWVEEHGGPNPSPANPTWWAGWVEGRDDSARIVRELATTTAPEGDDHA